MIIYDNIVLGPPGKSVDIVIGDDNTMTISKNGVLTKINAIVETVVANAEHANNADNATNAEYADNADDYTNNGNIKTKFDEIDTTIEPLENYNSTKTIEERLTELGFSTGNASDLVGIGSITLKKLGKFVVCKINYNRSVFSFRLPDGFAPYSTFTVAGVGRLQSGAGTSIDITINSNGTVSSTGGVGQVNYNIQLGWSTDSNYPI